MNDVIFSPLRISELELLIQKSISKALHQSANNQDSTANPDRWLNLNQLCEYLPFKPAKQTIYGLTMRKMIPFHHLGKSLAFKQSEVDEWLNLGRQMKPEWNRSNPHQYIAKRRKG